MTDYGNCRSCKAVVEWVRTAKTGARIPLDIQTTVGMGNIVLNDAGYAVVVPKGEGVRVSHFATCPNAARHRRKTKLGR